MASSYGQLGVVAQLRRDLDAAERRHRLSLTISQELGDRPGLARSYHQLGMVAQSRSNFDTAERWFRQSLTIEQELDNRPGMAISYVALGSLAIEQEDLEAALDWSVRCVSLFPEFPHPLTASGPRNLARLTALLGVPALETSWQRCTGAALPPHIRAKIGTIINEQNESSA